MHLSTRQMLLFGTCFDMLFVETLYCHCISCYVGPFHIQKLHQTRPPLLLSCIQTPTFVDRTGTCSYFVTVEEWFIFVLFDKQIMSALTYSKLVWSVRFWPSSNSHYLSFSFDSLRSREPTAIEALDSCRAMGVGPSGVSKPSGPNWRLGSRTADPCLGVARKAKIKTTNNIGKLHINSLNEMTNVVPPW